MLETDRNSPDAVAEPPTSSPPPAFAPDPVLVRGREGRWRLPWAILGTVFAVALLYVLAIPAIQMERLALSRHWLSGAISFESLLDPKQPYTFLDSALSFAPFMLAPMLTLVLVHGVSWRRAFSYGSGFDWRAYWKAALAWLIALCASTALIFLLEPQQFKLQQHGGDYAVWFMAGLVVIFVQSLAEEVLFKGYLLRVWGAVFPLRLPVSAVLIALFVSGHLLNTDLRADLWFNLIYFVLIEVLSFVVFFRTQNLGAAAGMHWSNNVFAFQLLATVPGQPTAMPLAVYNDPIVAAGGSHLLDPQAHAVALVMLALAAALLLHPRSPLYLPPQPPVVTEKATAAEADSGKGA